MNFIQCLMIIPVPLSIYLDIIQPVRAYAFLCIFRDMFTAVVEIQPGIVWRNALPVWKMENMVILGQLLSF